MLGVADAVVSLCRLGSDEALLTVDPRDHVEVWLADDEAARAMKELRGEDNPVF